MDESSGKCVDVEVVARSGAVVWCSCWWLGAEGCGGETATPVALPPTAKGANIGGVVSEGIDIVDGWLNIEELAIANEGLHAIGPGVGRASRKP